MQMRIESLHPGVTVPVTLSVSQTQLLMTAAASGRLSLKRNERRTVERLLMRINHAAMGGAYNDALRRKGGAK